jgi:hypothetical protein
MMDDRKMRHGIDITVLRLLEAETDQPPPGGRCRSARRFEVERS